MYHSPNDQSQGYWANPDLAYYEAQAMRMRNDYLAKAIISGVKRLLVAVKNLIVIPVSAQKA
ncbi:MAG: RSP_7527 family protein [Saccharospirillum sp.]